MVTGKMKADIVIPVHNSPDDVRRCLASCISALRAGDRVIIVDDGSDAETKDICRDAALTHPEQTLLIRRPEGTGFCRAANAGIREAKEEIVVLLNSDTVVPAGGLDRIEACFESNKDIGIVGPLSNAGGWQSIPHLAKTGPKNNKVASDDATLSEIQSYCLGLRETYEYPIVEQVNGFCLAVRRKVFEEIGLLDEERFPMGYGEEVDLNFRAQDAGFLSAIAIDCFVYHDKTKSYTSERRERLVAEGRVYIDQLHGLDRVKDAVRGSRQNPILESIRASALDAFQSRGWLREGNT